jgi:hypothetical protein
MPSLHLEEGEGGQNPSQLSLARNNLCILGRYSPTFFYSVEYSTLELTARALEEGNPRNKKCYSYRYLTPNPS